MNPTNEPTNPSNEPAANPAIPPLPQPLPPDASPGAILQALLKRPLQLVADLHQTTATRVPWVLGIFALLALAAYGLVVGSFSGGDQWWSAPVKVSLGALASAAICLPSLFIFLSLSGADVSLRSIVGTLCAALALTALMLIGLVPVAWVFSQSSDSVAFIGTLHIVFWLIALTVGLRVLGLLLDYLRIRERLHLKTWLAIFLLVSLQMTTALRPIVGTADHWLPKEKKFFVAYWIENLFPSTPPVTRD
ncbi:MAG: hypothetical protein P4L99_08070 [Chthoniobacter sp.]|nr:hypothetical protein [Chthoniobacter sp.]